MFYQTTFFVVILVGLVIADRKSSTFLAMTSSEGVDVCAVDVPTNIEWFPSHGSDIQCGLDCIRRTVCKAFNFHSLLGKCEHYETRATNFSVIPGCKGFIIADTNACLRLNGGCSQNVLCSHTELDLKCYCANGFQFSTDASYCQDINECLVNNGGCSTRGNSSCINTIGGFYCTCNGTCNVTSTLLGCYADNPWARDLSTPVLSYSYWSSNTNEKCRDYCANQLGTLYSGTQAAVGCYCGNTYGRYGPSNGCTWQCPGNTSTVCGASNTNTVMYTGVIGCFADNAQSHDLSSVPTNSSTTVITCRDNCYNQGYKFAGLQNGTWCYCGNTYGRYGTSSACGSGLANIITFTGN